MGDKDEYIGSLLLSLFLMQGEVDRLNQTLDLARKGELVYINNSQIDKLKAENERLKEEFEIESLTYKTTGETIYRSNLVNKYRTILQEIEGIAMGIMDDDIEESFAYSDARQILDLITKAESEG